MFTEAQNFAIVQTELDTVFFQTFQYDGSNPGIATAQTGDLFKPVTTDHAAYIGEINMGTGLWSVIGETQTVPSSTPAVRNKYTIYVKDFADSIEISKDLFDDRRLLAYCRLLLAYANEAINSVKRGNSYQDNPVAIYHLNVGSSSND